MKGILVLGIAILIAGASSADRLVRLYGDVPSMMIEDLRADGIEIATANLRAGYVDVVLPDRDVERAALYTDRYEVLPLEWGSLLTENRGNAGYYYSWEENNAFWATLAVQHPDLVDTPVSIGSTFQSRAINMVLITSNSGPAYKPAFIFTALTHAREPGGNSVLIDWANWLTTNYGSDTMATWILNNTRIYIVPIVNIDTYILNCNPYGGMLRKNQRPPDGVDLNRNYPYQWGYDDSGSSPDPYSETYRGASAGSEPETQAVMNFINAIDPIAGMHYHAYGGYLIRPWNYNGGHTPDESTYNTWSVAMTQYNGYTHGQCGDVLGYTSNGDADDWGYWNGSGHPRCMIFTPEVNDNGFWGGQTDTTVIQTICSECRYMNIWLCMNAPGFVGIEEGEGAPLPAELSLGAVTPNPVTGSASVVLNLSSPGATVAIYDLTGRLVSTVGTGDLRVGANWLQFTIPSEAPSGVYVLRATSGGAVSEGRFTVLR
jgi:hypothetical protein